MSAPIPATQVLGIGIALPRFIAPQPLMLQRVAEVLGESSPAAELAARLFRGAQVERRHLCDAAFLNGDGVLPLARRMQVFREEAAPLAAAACRQALEHARTRVEDVTHLVVVTSTGALTPGPDADLVALLGLGHDIERTLVAFMGCSGAFHGLRVARRAAQEGSNARVLLACVEVASIHCRPTKDPGNLAAHALFGDGAAALVLASAADRSEPVLLELGAQASRLASEGRDLLTWELRPEGFEVNLSADLPAFLEPRVRPFLDPLLDGRAPSILPSWSVHPGGPAILRALERALGLGGAALASSYDALRYTGNVSSGSVLFVLQRELDRAEPGSEGMMLGFGPGLTLEAIRYRRGGLDSGAAH
jgi:predicted naringenin-chalcone synthase